MFSWSTCLMKKMRKRWKLDVDENGSEMLSKLELTSFCVLNFFLASFIPSLLHFQVSDLLVLLMTLFSVN